MKTEFTVQQLADPQLAVAAKAIRNCVHCGFCLATCPTYVLLNDERDSPRGRIYLMKEMLEGGQRPTADVVRHVDRCLSCLACATTCPSGVDYMHLVDHARAYIQHHYRRPAWDRLLRWGLARILPHRERLRWAMRLGRWATPLMRLTRHYRALDPVTQMLALTGRGAAARAPAIDSPAANGPRGRVLLMQGCAESVVRPQIRAATVRLLNRLGYEVIFAPREACCGALTHHMGREQDALRSIRDTVDRWTEAMQRGGADRSIGAIVITTSGCGTLIKDYGFILRDDAGYAAKAATISALAKDISELVRPEDLAVSAGMRALRVAYHPACSLQHGQKIVMAPKALLAACGFEVRTPEEAHLCCGSAGTYNILQPAIARRLGERKAERLAALKADVIATGNVGCITQLSMHAATPVVHVVELLDWATGGPAPDGLAVRENGADPGQQ